MNILNIEHISKIFGEKVIFRDASFGIQEGDKVGIIGINGTGKSTLLKMIAGEVDRLSGRMAFGLLIFHRIRYFRLKQQWLPMRLKETVIQIGLCRAI